MSTDSPKYGKETIPLGGTSELVFFDTQDSLAEITERLRFAADQEADAFVEWINNIDLDSLPEGVTYSKSETGNNISLKIALSPKESSIPPEFRALCVHLDPEIEDDLIINVSIQNPLEGTDAKDMSTVMIAPQSLLDAGMINKDREDLPKGKMGFALNVYQSYSEFTEWKGEKIEWKRPGRNFRAFGQHDGVYAMNLAFGTNTVFQDSLRLDLMQAIKRIVEPENTSTNHNQDSSAIGRIIEMTQGTEEALVEERREIAKYFPGSLMLEIDPMDERVSPLLRCVLADWGISLEEPVLIQAINTADPHPIYGGAKDKPLSYLVEPFSLTPNNSGFMFFPADARTPSSGFVSLGRNNDYSVGYNSSGGRREFHGFQAFQPNNFYLESGITDPNGGGRGLMERQIELALARTIRLHLSEAYDPNKKQGQDSSKQLGKVSTKKFYRHHK